ncbi:MAG: AAA family ATPase [Acidaminobacteraceae bacterium]
MIKKLNVKSFGAIKDKDLSFEKNLNIIYGGNEAGKSTIHEALRSLLFGFSPAKLENHSYKPWDDSKIYLEGEIDTGKNISVTRKLADKPEGNVMFEGEIKAIANKALENVSHISKDIFKQVYAVTLDDMNNLSNRSMELVFDGLVENYGLDFLNAPSEVIKDIQSKENDIYRENRRGNYRVKEIDNEIREIKTEIRNSEKSVDEYFKSKIELEEINKIKKEKVSELCELNSRNSRLIELMDIFKQNKFLKELRDEIGFRQHSFNSLLDHIKSIKLLRGEIRSKDENLKMLKLDIEREILKVDFLDEGEKELLRKRPNYIIAKRYITNLRQIIRDIDYKKTIHSETILSRNMLGKELFSKDLSKYNMKFLESLDVISLKKYIDDEEKKSYINDDMSIFKMLTLPVLMTVLIIASLYLGYKQIAYITSIALSALLMKIYKDYKSDRRELSIYDANIELLLGELPVPRIFIETIDKSYFEKIFKLKEIHAQILKVETEIELLDEVKVDVWNKIVITLEDKRLSSEEVSIITLDTVLDEFIINVENIKIKELSRKSSEDRIKEIKDRYNDLLEEKENRSRVLDGKFEYAYDFFGIDHESLENLIIDELRVDKACEVEEALGSVLDIVSKIEDINSLESSGAEFSTSYLSNLKLKSSELIEELNIIENNVGKLNEKVENLYSTDKRDDLFASLKRLKTERGELMIKRAMLTTSRETISRYDKDFRDENQPDILKNTSDYFSIITDNKYEKVYMQSETNELILRSEFGEKSIDSGFSRGTREQLYFCFRLAIIKHLCDDTKHNLPIILDDIFVNWDFDRIKTLKKLLLEISKDRQIIMFTCHKSQLEAFLDKELTNTVIL